MIEKPMFDLFLPNIYFEEHIFVNIVIFIEPIWRLNTDVTLLFL